MKGNCGEQVPTVTHQRKCFSFYLHDYHMKDILQIQVRECVGVDLSVWLRGSKCYTNATIFTSSQTGALPGHVVVFLKVRQHMPLL